MQAPNVYYRIRRGMLISALFSTLLETIILSKTPRRFANYGILSGALCTALLFVSYLYSGSSEKSSIVLEEPSQLYRRLLVLGASILSLIFATLCGTKETIISLFYDNPPQMPRIYENVAFMFGFCFLLIVTSLVFHQELCEHEATTRDNNQDWEMTDYTWQRAYSKRSGSAPPRYTA